MKTEKKIRIGIILDSLFVENWKIESLREIAKNEKKMHETKNKRIKSRQSITHRITHRITYHALRSKFDSDIKKK